MNLQAQTRRALSLPPVDAAERGDGKVVFVFIFVRAALDFKAFVHQGELERRVQVERQTQRVEAGAEVGAGRRNDYLYALHNIAAFLRMYSGMPRTVVSSVCMGARPRRDASAQGTGT